MEELIFKKLVRYGFVIESYDILGVDKKGYIAVYYSKNGNILGTIVSDTTEYGMKINSASTYLNMKGHENVTLNAILIMNKSSISIDEVAKFQYNNAGIICINYNGDILGSIGAEKGVVDILREGYEDNSIPRKKKELKPIKLTVTNVLIAINIIIFIISAVLSGSILDINPYVLLAMGAKWNPLIHAGQYYRFITAFFLHGGIMHVALNMYSLKIIGNLIENIYGKSRYIIIYFLSGIASTIASYLFSTSLSVGASGAIFGLLGAALIVGYKRRHIIGNAFFSNILEVIVINVVIGFTVSNIDNFAHFGGLIVGVILSLFLYKSN